MNNGAAGIAIGADRGLLHVGAADHVLAGIGIVGVGATVLLGPFVMKVAFIHRESRWYGERRPEILKAGVDVGANAIASIRGRGMGDVLGADQDRDRRLEDHAAAERVGFAAGV